MSTENLNIAGKLGRSAMNSYVTPIAGLLIFMVGLLALFITPREENPQIDVPAANVSVHIPGATPEEVLNQVVRPMEMILREMEGIDHTYGLALYSMGIVTVQFEVGNDKEESLVRLYDRVMQSHQLFPPGSSLPMVQPLDIDDVPVITITLSSDVHSDMTLKQLAQRIKEQMTPLEGVSVATILGGRNRTVQVNIDPDRLSSHNISLLELYRTLNTGNTDLSAGYTVNDSKVKTIRLQGSLTSAKDVGNIVIAVHNTRPVYLHDVATITDGPEDIEKLHRIGFGLASENYSAQGEPEKTAVTLMLAKKRGTNAVFVSDRIIEKLELLKGDMIPDDINTTITRNSGERADAAVNILIEHLFIAIVSIVIIMLVFLGWREAAIVTMNIPLILFIVLAVDFFFGQTINRITLFALILALGLLVDDAIVVIENIHRHLKKGATSAKDKAAIIIRATNETGHPTIIATLAVILAFIPMMFVTGMMGPYMGPIPFNTAIAMLASLIIAYMFTPWIALRWLPAKITTNKNIAETDIDEDQQDDWLIRLYTKTIQPLMVSTFKRRAFWSIIAIAFVASMWQPAWQFVRPSGINGPATPGTVELKMLPKGNQNTFNITLDMPEGTPLEKTDQVARRIGDVLRTHPMITDYESHIGMAGPIDFNGMLRGAANKQGLHLAEIRVNLIDKRQRSSKSEHIVLDLRDMLSDVYSDFPNANIKLAEDPPGPPVRATLLAEVYGPDYATVQRIAHKIHGEFADTWDIVDIDNSIGDDQIEYIVTVDKEKAAAAGIATAQIATLLRDVIGGYDIGVIHDTNERSPVRIHIQIPRDLRISPRDMDRLFVTNHSGEQIPVSAITSVKEVIAKKPIYTKDGYPVVYVSGEPKTGSQVYPLLDLDSRIDGAEIIEGITVTTAGMRFTHVTANPAFDYQVIWDGEMRLTLDVFRDLGAAFIVGLILIYVLLVAYYGNFGLPLVVMGAIPLTMIGIFPGHMISDQPFTATSMIGMIALGGIVVRNSVLLLDFILAYRATGMTLHLAVIRASATRARPILLTALAVIAGTSILMSDPVFGGLGVSMAFGTFASTLLTLYVIPLVYFLWQRNKPETI